MNSMDKTKILECDYSVLRLAGFVSCDEQGGVSEQVVTCIRNIINSYMDSNSMTLLIHGFKEGVRKGYKTDRDIKILKNSYGTEIDNYLKVLSLLITVLLADRITVFSREKLYGIAASFGLEKDELDLLISRMDTGRSAKHEYTRSLMTLIGWIAAADGEMTSRQKEYANTVISEVGDVTSDFYGDFVHGFELDKVPESEIGIVCGFLSKSFESDIQRYNNVRIGCLCLLIGGVREDRRPPAGETYSRLLIVAEALGFSDNELNAVIRHLENSED